MDLAGPKLRTGPLEPGPRVVKVRPTRDAFGRVTRPARIWFSSQQGLSASQLAIAWVLTKGSTIVPLIGARTRTQLAESLGALQVELSPSDVARMEKAVPASAVAGSRYDAHQMQILDSER